jgi:hypothetical protein
MARLASHSGGAEASSRMQVNIYLAGRRHHYPQTLCWRPDSPRGWAVPTVHEESITIRFRHEHCPNRTLHMSACSGNRESGVLPQKVSWLLKSTGLHAVVNIDDKAPCMQEPGPYHTGYYCNTGDAAPNGQSTLCKTSRSESRGSWRMQQINANARSRETFFYSFRLSKSSRVVGLRPEDNGRTVLLATAPHLATIVIKRQEIYSCRTILRFFLYSS